MRDFKKPPAGLITAAYTDCVSEINLGIPFRCPAAWTAGPDLGMGIVGKCLWPTTSKEPTKDGCKIFWAP